MQRLYKKLLQAQGDELDADFARRIGISHSRLYKIKRSIETRQSSLFLITFDRLAEGLGRETLHLTREGITTPLVEHGDAFVEELGRVFFNYRQMARLSRNRAAAVTRVSVTSIREYEMGTRAMSFSSLYKMCEGLRLHPTFLVEPVYCFERFVAHNT